MRSILHQITELAETLNNEEKQALESFNKSNETNYMYPDFDAKNDLLVRLTGITKKPTKDADKINTEIH